MRAIYGKPGNPDSSHILIIRGVDVYSIDYFTEHVKGKLLEPEYSHLFNFEIEKDSPDVITISSSMVVGRKEIPTIESGPFYGPTY